MKKILILALLTLSIAFWPIGADLRAQPQKLKIGCVETSLGIVEALTPHVKERGYEIEPVIFDNNVNVVRALNDGALDASLGVHKPFMEKFNADNEGDLVMVEPYAYYAGMGLFSNKHKNVSDFPEKSRIAIMNDAMNMDRALRILGDAGLLKLKPTDGILTTLDIADNPRKLELIEVRNHADSLIYATEKSLADLGDKVWSMPGLIAARFCSATSIQVNTPWPSWSKAALKRRPGPRPWKKGCALTRSKNSCAKNTPALMNFSIDQGEG